MKTKTIILLFVVVLLVGTAFAGDSPNGCKLQGTWYGVIPGAGAFVVQYHGTGDNNGTDDTEWVKLDDALLGMGISRASNSRGVWTKTAPNIYNSTLLTFWYDADGQIAMITRAHGTKLLTDCDTMEYKGTFIEVLDFDMNVLYWYPDPSIGEVRRVLPGDCCP
jgi:hypothetical protein